MQVAAGDRASAPPDTAAARRRRLAWAAASLGLGTLLPLALAPLHWLPLLAVSFSGLFLLMERTRGTREACLFGWLFGLGAFVVGLSWIAESFSVDPERFGGLAVPAVVGLSAFLAVFPALGCAAARWIAPAGSPRLGLVAALVACWSAAEWARSTVLTGFPWNLVGTAWGFADAPMQAASVFGLHGLSLVTVAIATLPAVAVSKAGRPIALTPGLAAPALIAAGLGLALLWAHGAWRLSLPEPPPVNDVRLRIVQPDVPQSAKWDPAEAERIVARLLAMSTAPGRAPTHVIWPESAVPFLLTDDAELRAWIGAAVPAGGALLTGAVRLGEDPPGPRNALLALDDTGRIIAAYDKVRLVPFGEFLPLRSWLPAGLRKMTAGETDFVPGRPRAALAVAGLPPLWPLICYEAVFPEAPGALGLEGTPRNPGWLLTVTNDAWFGMSWGPYQHFLAARFRAVELGLPLVRAANGGISAIVDARGRVVDVLPLGARGIMDAALPGALPPTPYARWGELPFAFALGLLLAGGIAARRFRSTENTP
jgi:apolipoprotein N-acyltransferase